MSRTFWVVGLVIALLTPTAAHADRWSGGDERGDVEGSKYHPDPPPCGSDTAVDGTAETNEDITALRVRHTRRTVVLAARFADLDPGLEQWLALYVRAPGGGWWLDVDRYQTRSGQWRTSTFLAEEPDLPDPDDVEGCGIGISLVDVGCRIARTVDLERDSIRVGVPRRCLDDPRWVRVAADAYRIVEPADSTDPSFTVFSDEWDAGVELSPWAPPYGPRVRATEGASIGTPRSQASAGAPEQRTAADFVAGSRVRYRLSTQ